MSFGKTGCLAEENTLYCLARPMPAWKIEPIFGGKLFRGQGYLAQIGAASRTDPRKTAIGDRDRPRGTGLWPGAYLLSSGEFVLGAGDHSLFTNGGTALVIHAKADDMKSDPAGNAGDRIACGTITK